MSTDNVTTVGGFGHSNKGETTVITNIGAKGTNFAGTFIGRSAYYAFDFVTSIYTDKDDTLYVSFQCGDTNIEIVQEEKNRIKFQLNKSYPVGYLVYDSASGDLNIISADTVWFQGTVSGMYVDVH